jgi:hypothetical protein
MTEKDLIKLQTIVEQQSKTIAQLEEKLNRVAIKLETTNNALERFAKAFKHALTS